MHTSFPVFTVPNHIALLSYKDNTLTYFLSPSVVSLSYIHPTKLSHPLIWHTSPVTLRTKHEAVCCCDVGISYWSCLLSPPHRRRGEKK